MSGASSEGLWSRIRAHPRGHDAIQALLHRRTRAGVLVAAVCLLSLLLDSRSVVHEPGATGAALALMLVGASIRIAALGVIRKRKELACTGVYSLCRHPLYLGTILMVGGACVLFANPVCTVAALGYFLAFYPLTMAKEEQQNLERFGAAFVAYRTTTPMLLPLGAWRPAESFDWVRALVRGGLGALACVPLALLLAVLVGHEFAAWL